MDVTVVSHEENKLSLLLEKAEPPIANAIRRTLIAEIPIMGVDDVTFYENTSVMPDEYIAHRLAMIPLKTDLKSYKLPEDCCGGNCSSCSVELVLDEAGPKMVYSSDLKTSDPKIKPVTGKIPIMELSAGQRLRLEAKAVLGKGEDHAKWQAGLAGYKYFPMLKADYRKLKNVKEIANSCPVGALKVKAGKLELNPVKCTNCGECEKFVGDTEAFSIGFDKNNFVFVAETNGQITAKEALLQSIKMIGGKIQSMQSQL